MISHKQYKGPSYKLLSIPYPGSGGINIQDLDYQLDENQSPKMLNMMIKNGVFGKRYGQKTLKDLGSEIIAIGKYMGNLILHVNNKLIKYNPHDGSTSDLFTGLSTRKGTFINFNRMIYYLSDKYIQYDNSTCKQVEPYAPDICINRKPDGSYADLVEDYNRLGNKFKNTFHGDGSSTVFHLTDINLDNGSGVMCEVNGRTLGSGEYSVDYSAGRITFSSPPSKGTNNVVITAQKTEQQYIDSIMNNKYWCAYGGQNNSRLFLGGGGKAIYYYSDVFDATYFPESNYAILGNGEEDITGFGIQYDTMVVLKPHEIFAVNYYFTEDKDGFSKANFSSAILSTWFGCDVPLSISYVDNKLIWTSTEYGVCILVQTVIKDERNVQKISRNIDGGTREAGLLQEPNLKNAVAINHDGKYMLCINGKVYLWDYRLTPYAAETSRPDYSAKKLAWFIWDKVNVQNAIVFEDKAYLTYGSKVNTLGNNLDDFGAAINSYYQTPLLDFESPEMLKTIKRMYVQARGDTPSIINVKYISEEQPEGEKEIEKLNVYTHLWNEFNWSTWGWQFITFANTFSRKCAIKKVQLFGILFSNNQANKDMSFSNLELQYALIKPVK